MEPVKTINHEAHEDTKRFLVDPRNSNHQHLSVSYF